MSLKAFEFGLWEHRNPENSTFTISSSAKDDPNKVITIADALPKAPKAGSVGGHDLERTVVEIDQSLNNVNDAVIVLLLNSAPSQGAPGEKLIGGNDTNFQAVLERWNRVAGTKEGASLEMPYKVLLANGGSTEAKLSAVIFAPKTFSGVSLSAGSRSELLAGSATNAQSNSSPNNGFPIWLLAIPALAALGYFGFRALSNGGNASGTWNLTIDGGSPDRFGLSSVTNGRTIVELVGTNYQTNSGDPSSQIRKAPDSTAVARFVRVAGGVKLEGLNGFEVKELDNDAHSGTATIKTGSIENHDVVLGGNVLNSNGISREVNINVSFRLSKDGS